MYVVLPGSQNLGRITTQDHSIMAGKLQKKTVLLLFLAEPKCNILLASNIKWQTVNAFKALVQQHP